ncbi:MAG: head-tail adaptor protein [Firmicutes bacterium]|nr:head-tail adaptor protein [Bacillota bacterium]
MNPAIARRNVERQIQRNPTDIWIKRIVEADDGAGGTIRQEIMLPVQTVRVFMGTYSQSKEIATEAVQMQIQRWGMLARWDADIQLGDVFTAQGRSFRIRDIDQVATGGDVIALHVDLEEVS